MSKIVQILLIVVVIAAGMAYAILSDPELPTQGLFKATLREFSKHVAQLEKQLKNSNGMRTSQKNFTVIYSDENNPLTQTGVAGKFVINMQISKNLVTLMFSNKTGLLAGQSIMLEPKISDKVVKWKCINGSVLARVRTKNCRLGYGHSQIEMSQL